jgi:hypothetical protein
MWQRVPLLLLANRDFLAHIAELTNEPDFVGADDVLLDIRDLDRRGSACVTNKGSVLKGTLKGIEVLFEGSGCSIVGFTGLRRRGRDAGWRGRDAGWRGRDAGWRGRDAGGRRGHRGLGGRASNTGCGRWGAGCHPYRSDTPARIDASVSEVEEQSLLTHLDFEHVMLNRCHCPPHHIQIVKFNANRVTCLSADQCYVSGLWRCVDYPHRHDPRRWGDFTVLDRDSSASFRIRQLQHLRRHVLHQKRPVGCHVVSHKLNDIPYFEGDCGIHLLLLLSFFCLICLCAFLPSGKPADE